MSLLSVLERVAEHKPEEFVAPVPQANQVTLFTYQQQIPYRFKLQNPQAGWWSVMPRSKTEAVLNTQAQPYQKFEYLEQLPRFYVIAVTAVNESTWICVPYNIADASQRGWKNAQPKHVFLVSGTIEPFDVLVTRRLGQILLYETVNTRIVSTVHKYCRDNIDNLEFKSGYPSYDIAMSIIREIREQERQTELRLERELQEQARQREIEELRQNIHAFAERELTLSGAELLDLKERRNGYSVTWRYNGAEFTMPLLQNLQVESAGICLAGTDQRYSLAQIVHVMEDARRRNRFDLDRELWL